MHRKASINLDPLDPHFGRDGTGDTSNMTAPPTSDADAVRHEREVHGRSMRHAAMQRVMLAGP
jgi:hypothetical protein